MSFTMVMPKFNAHLALHPFGTDTAPAAQRKAGSAGQGRAEPSRAEQGSS